MLILLFSTLVCTNSWYHLETFQQNDTGVSGPVNSFRVQIHLPRRTDRISGLTAGKAPTARGCKGTKRIYVCYLLVCLRWIFKTVSLRIKGPRGISSSKRTFLLFPWIKWCSFRQAFDMMVKNFSRGSVEQQDKPLVINAKIKTGYKRLLNHPQKGGWGGEKKEQLRKKRKLGRPSQSMIKVN